MADKKEKMKKDESIDEEPGEQNELLMHSSQVEEVKNLIVFLRDRTGIHFNLQDAAVTQCCGLLQLIIQEQNLPEEACDIFCLWLISPVLELRLKKHHNPFQVVQKWEELCTLYSDASLEEIHQNEPVLMMQRDVYFSKEQEQQIQNEQILSLLYHEAVYKVIEGRYILHEEDYHYLAGIQAVIQLGSFNSAQSTLAEYRSNLFKFYPDHMYAQSRFKFLKHNSLNQISCEESFMEAHKRYSEEFCHNTTKDLYRKYLTVLWTYPFYGVYSRGSRGKDFMLETSCQPSDHVLESPFRLGFLKIDVDSQVKGAFFFGRVEAKMTGIRRFILPKSDLRVNICITTEGVSVFSAEKDEFLLYVPYAQLSWMYQDLVWDGDNDPPPTLMLQFICDEKHEQSQDEPVTKLLQIYSRQAKLMDALIKTCVDRKLEIQRSTGVDFVDGGSTEISEKKMLNKLGRLSLETYTKDGDQLDPV